MSLVTQSLPGSLGSYYTPLLCTYPQECLFLPLQLREGLGAQILPMLWATGKTLGVAAGSGLTDLRGAGAYKGVPGLFPPKFQSCLDTVQESF